MHGTRCRGHNHTLPQITLLMRNLRNLSLGFSAAEKTAMQKKLQCKTNAMQKKLQCKKNCNAKKLQCKKNAMQKNNRNAKTTAS